MIQTEPLVAWLREAGPYIEQFRGKTFVVRLSDADRSEMAQSRLAEDLVLLSALGVRLVLVQSTRAAIDAHVARVGGASHYFHSRRITDPALLQEICHLAVEYRVEFGGLLMRAEHRNHGQTPVVSGSFVSAKPLGIHQGIDHQLTGSVRRIDAQAIHAQLELGAMVYLDHLAHSPAGRLYNLASEEVATETAIALQADKLILLGETPACLDAEGTQVSELSLSELPDIQNLQSPEMQRRLVAAGRAVTAGVGRAHLLDASADGAILTELMTTAGTGTVLTAQPLAVVREARPDDLAGLLHLLAPLEASGALVQRSREKLEAEIAHFLVCEQDGRILGSAALYPLDDKVAELAALAVDSERGRQTIGSRLLAAIEVRAKTAGLEQLCVLTTQAADWFRERGFVEASIEALPANRQRMYNYQRNSAILTKTL